MKKNILGALFGAGMVLAITAPAFAADCTNEYTGPKSSNHCDIRNTTKTHLWLTNRADIDNTIKTTAKTGNNEEKGNTIGGEIKSGEATASTAVVNDVNNNVVSISQGNSDCGCTASGLNTHTGPHSKNSVEIKNTKEVSVGLYNNADIENNVTTSASTGGNESKWNTVGGSIESGPATATTTVANYANNNSVTIIQ